MNRFWRLGLVLVSLAGLNLACGNSPGPTTPGGGGGLGTLFKTRTATSTRTETSTPLPTSTFTSTSTRTDTATPTETSTETHTRTQTLTRTSTPTLTDTPTQTVTETPSSTRTQTSTFSSTLSATDTSTQTSTASSTSTPSATPTPTETSTATNTRTATASPSFTATGTSTSTPTITPTRTETPTLTSSATSTPTVTATFTSTVYYSLVRSIDAPTSYLDVVGSSPVSIFAVSTNNFQVYVYNASTGAEITHWNTTDSGAQGIAVDPTGSFVYVSEGSHLEKFNFAGTSVGYWPSIKGEGLDIDPAGNVYVVLRGGATGAGRVYKYSSTGTPISNWGGYSFPSGIAVDGVNSKVYVADNDNNRVVRTGLDGSNPEYLTHTVATYPYSFMPFGVALDALGNLFVGDFDIVRKFDFDTQTELIKWNLPGFFDAYPYGLSVDSSGFIYAADNYNGEILIYAPQ